MNTDIYIPQADLTGFCNVWVPYSSRALDFRRLWRAEHGLLYYRVHVWVWVWFTGINLSNKEQNLSSSSCHSKPKWFSGTEKKIFCRMFKLVSTGSTNVIISWFCSKLRLWVHVWISAQPFQGCSRCSKDGLCYMCAFVCVHSGRYFIEFRHCRTSVMPTNIYLTASRTNGLIKSSLQSEWVSVALPHYFMICHRHLPPYYRLQELQSQTETFHQGNSLHLMRCFVEM